jgi:hypothetical protein
MQFGNNGIDTIAVVRWTASDLSRPEIAKSLKMAA